MESKKRLVYNKKLKTMFLTPLEIKNYMSILGANIIDDNTFILDGLKCGVDREYQGIYFLGGIPQNVSHLFEKYGLEDSIYGWIIFDLEGLILLHTTLCNESIDECFTDNLEQAKKEMLERVLTEKEIIDFNSPFGDFDRAVTPFLCDDFDPKKFLEQCVFNTTGYYEKEGYNKCLKFQWRTKQDPDTLYAITVNKDGFHDTIMFKEWPERFHQQLYHFTYDGKDLLKFFYGKNSHTEFDVKKGEITESIEGTENKREATKFDILKMSAIASSFQNDELLFTKSTSKKKIK